MIDVKLHIPEGDAADHIRSKSYAQMGFGRRPGVRKILEDEIRFAFKAGGVAMTGSTNAWTENSEEWTRKKMREGRSTRKMVYKGKLFRSALRARIRAVKNDLVVEWNAYSEDKFDYATYWQDEDKETFRKIVATPRMYDRLSQEALAMVCEQLQKFGWVIEDHERSAA